MPKSSKSISSDPVQYRQGDVFIERISRLPAGLSSVEPDGRGRIVLAEGEMTGHSHSLAVSAHVVGGRSADGTLYLCLSNRSNVVHEEHEAVELPAGSYRVTRQREYSPQEIRTVAD